MAKDVFSETLTAQLNELHGRILAEHRRALQNGRSHDQASGRAEPDASQKTCSDSSQGLEPHRRSLQLPSSDQEVAPVVRGRCFQVRNEDREEEVCLAPILRNGRHARPHRDSLAFQEKKSAKGAEVSKRHRGSNSSFIQQQDFAIHSYWRDEASFTPANAFRRRTSARSEVVKSQSGNWLAGEFSRKETRFERMTSNLFGGLIAHPNSRTRLVWDVVGLMLICYDIVVLPLQVFDMEPTTGFIVMGWIALLFWTLDLPSSFFVGYHTLGGTLVMSFTQIAKRYVCTWFALDIFLVTVDWMILLVTADGASDGNNSSYESIGLARLGKTVRVMRLLRMLRLMRLAKLPKYFVQIEEHIQSEYVVVLLGILKLTACILVINHLIACLWFAIGNIEDDNPSWVHSYGYDGQEISFKYTTALHWSLTQFTPASMEVFPRNVRERSFALVVLVFALITFSSFVSSITNAMTHLRNMNSEYAKQFVQLGRYLRYHKISTPVAVRVRRHLARTIVKRQQRLEESEVSLLKMLSEPLLMDLRLEVFRTLLDCHPFFLRYGESNFVAVRKLCHTAIVEFSLAPGDLLFSPGEICDRMFFVKSGILRYSHEHHRDLPSLGSDPGTPETDVAVRSNEWICEACLWTPWRHCGHMHAFTGSGLVALEAEKFSEVARRTRSATMHPVRYAEHFVQHLNGLGPHELTDLHCPSFDHVRALAMSCAPVPTESEVASSRLSSCSVSSAQSSTLAVNTVGPLTKETKETKESL